MAVTITSITDDTGVSDSDNLTSDTTFDLKGNVDIGANVMIFEGTTFVGAATVATDGSWILPVNVSAADPNGEHVYTAVAFDGVTGGFLGTAAPYTVTIDNLLDFDGNGTAEAAPADIALTITDDTGATDAVVNASGNTTDTDLTVSGAGEIGATVEVFSNGLSVGTTTVTEDPANPGNGIWSLQTGILPGGATSINAVVTDDAGNSLNSGPTNFNINSNVPQPPVISTFDGAGTTSNGHTADGAPAFTGTAENGQNVTLTLTNTVTGATHSVTVTADGSGDWTVNNTAWANANPPVDGTNPLPEASYTVSAIQTVNSVASPATTVIEQAAGATDDLTEITLDRTAPDAPTALAYTPDTGSSNSDDYTNATSGIISGEGEAGTLITVTIAADAIPAAGGNPLVPAFLETITDIEVAADGTWSVDLSDLDGDPATTPASDSITLDPDRTYSFTAAATDLAGNVGVDSTPLPVIVDTEYTATPDMVALDDVPVDGGAPIVADEISVVTNDNIPTFSNDPNTPATLAEPGSNVIIFDQNNNIVAQTTANQFGQWSVDATAALADGEHTFRAAFTDLAGNPYQGVLPSVTFTVDTATTAPQITEIDTNTGPEFASGATTGDNTLTIKGTAEAGATVQVLMTTATGPESYEAIANADGLWVLDQTEAGVLPDGPLSIIVTATDPAGNTALNPVPFNITINPVVATPAIIGYTDDEGIFQGTNRTTSTTDDVTVDLHGTSAPGTTAVNLFDGSGTQIATNPGGNLTIAANGNWTITGVNTTAIDVDFSITTNGPAPSFQESNSSETFALALDTSSLVPTILGLTTATDTGNDNYDNLTNLTAITVEGIGEPGGTILLAQDGVPLNLPTPPIVDSNGEWSVDITVTPQETHVFTAQLIDAAGNSASAFSAPTLASTIVVDTVALATPVLAAFDPTTDIDADGTITLSGTVANFPTDVDVAGGDAVGGVGATVVVLNNGNPLVNNSGQLLDAAGELVLTTAGQPILLNFTSNAIVSPVVPATDGTFDFDIAGLPEDNYNLSVVSVDAAGNESAPSAVAGVVLATAPIFSTPDNIFFEGTSQDTPIMVVNADDPDGVDTTEVTYALSGVDADQFTIVSGASLADMADNNPLNDNGLLQFSGTPSFNAPTDANGDNIYEVTVTATDEEGQTTNQDLTITYSDKDLTYFAGTVFTTDGDDWAIGSNTSADRFFASYGEDTIIGDVGIDNTFTLADAVDPASPTGAEIALAAAALTDHDEVGFNRANEIAGETLATRGVNVDLNLTTAQHVWTEAGHENDTVTLVGIENVNGTIFGDEITGNAEDNVLTGYNGGDMIWGNDGDDTLIGDYGNDFLYGGAGDDTINGGNHNDWMEGGTGTDSYNGGSGTDTVSFLHDSDAVGGVNVNLSGAAVGGVAAQRVEVTNSINESIVEVENIYGNVGNDTFTGNGQANTFYGFGGDDTFNSSLGGDTFIGGGGSDTFNFDGLEGWGDAVIQGYDIYGVDDALVAVSDAAIDSIAVVGTDTLVTFSNDDTITFENNINITEDDFTLI